MYKYTLYIYIYIYIHTHTHIIYIPIEMPCQSIYQLSENPSVYLLRVLHLGPQEGKKRKILDVQSKKGA